MSAATRTINYGRVLEVMSLVSAAGFRKVSLVAEAPKGHRGRRPAGAPGPAIGRVGAGLTVAMVGSQRSIGLWRRKNLGAAERMTAGLAFSAALHSVARWF